MARLGGDTCIRSDAVGKAPLRERGTKWTEFGRLLGMDAGLAGLLGGVIGAAVGALGATGSAYITGRKAEQQTRIAIRSQLAQTQWQLRLEYLNQRHEPRAKAYSAVLTQAAEVLQLLERAIGCQEADDESQYVDVVQQIEEKLHGFAPLYARVRVEGPDSMLTPTRELESVLTDFLWPMETFFGFDAWEELMEFRNKASMYVDKFQTASTGILNDDQLASRITGISDDPLAESG